MSQVRSGSFAAKRLAKICLLSPDDVLRAMLRVHLWLGLKLNVMSTSSSLLPWTVVRT